MAGSVEMYQIQIEFDANLSRAIYNSWVKLRESGISSFFFTKLIKERPNIPLLNSNFIDVNKIRSELIRFGLKRPSHVPINLSFVGMEDLDFSANILSLHPIPNTALCDLQRDVCQLVAQAGSEIKATTPQCQIACHLENPLLVPAYWAVTSALTSLPLRGYAAELAVVKYTFYDAGRVAVDEQLGIFCPAITLKRDKLLSVALRPPPLQGKLIFHFPTLLVLVSRLFNYLVYVLLIWVIDFLSIGGSFIKVFS